MKQSDFNIQRGEVLNDLLGYRSLMSFANLYPDGGSPNTYGHPEASMHTLKHELNTDGKIRFIAIHSTYFKPSEQVTRLNAFIDCVGPLTQDEAIAFFQKV